MIWVIDAWLKWQPGFRATMLPSMVAAATGTAALADAVVRFLDPPNATRTGTVVVSHRRHRDDDRGHADDRAGRRAVYIGGALYSLMIWSTAEGFGGPYAPGATDVGPSIIYVLVFLAMLVMLDHRLDRHLALDNAIARRVPWWHRIAGPAVR